MIKLKNPLIKKRENLMVWKVFLTALGIGIVMILPFIIKDGGYFFYYGDYNVQQVPFWQYCAEQVKSGNFFWSWETDLGSDFISAYSFYTIGSPFFWLAMIFPSSWMPALMGPLMMLKMAVAAVGAFLYMRRYIKDPDYAMIGALLYAFSSYTIYNIFFNHFIDVVAVFPFMLLAF
ncbi:MAG TPA: YfhO family protein, partial [Clostridiales bacterium]|nr:YfhO family protein [Clostridiales bacterium]